MSMGKIKFQQGKETDNSPLYLQMLKTTKAHTVASKKAAYDALIGMKVVDKVARAATTYYVADKS